MIDYSLTNHEFVIFPILPAYGIRHLKKEGWQNKVIGVIELFPLLGPIVALIEKIAVSFFNKNASITPIIPRIHMDEFKPNALGHLNKTAQKPPEFKLDLTDEQELLLTETIVQLEQKLDQKNITVHSKNGIWVFSIDKIPHMIFKMAMKWDRNKSGNFDQRLKDTQTAQSIIASENLYLLHAPKQRLHTISVDGKPVEVLMEQKFDLIHGTLKQKQLFQHCLHDKELQPFIQECARQLVTLICKTGYKDVRYDNNPMITNGMGLALIDMDTSSSPITGLTSGCSTTGDDGILRGLTPDIIDSFEPLLKSLLPEEHFKELNLPEIRKEQERALKRYEGFQNYLTTRDPLKRRVKLQSKEFDKRLTKKLEENVHSIAMHSLGINPIEERIYYFNSLPGNELSIQKELNQLKDNNSIYDWWNPPRAGYYVMC